MRVLSSATKLGLVVSAIGVLGACGGGSRATAGPPSPQALKIVVTMEGSPVPGIVATSPIGFRTQAAPPAPGSTTCSEPGPLCPTAVQLTRLAQPLSPSDPLDQWIRESLAGTSSRKDFSIRILLANDSPIQSFTFEDCLLTSFDFPAVEAGSGEVLKQALTLKPERMTVD